MEQYNVQGINVEQKQEEQQRIKKRFNIRNVIMKYFIYWKWFVVSVILCLIGAYFSLKYTTPIYNITATIMLKDKQKGDFSSQMQSLEDFGLMKNVNNVDNEIEVLTSKSLIKQTVIDLKLYTNYIGKGRISQQHLYRSTPVSAEIGRDDVNRMSRSLSILLKMNSDSKCKLTYSYIDDETLDEVEVEDTIVSWPFMFHSPIGDIVLIRHEEIPFDGTINISFVPPMRAAKSYLGALSITPTSKTTSVAAISFMDASRARGIDFVNQLVYNYNLNANNDKNIVAQQTDNFINERIKQVSGELGTSDAQVEQFKRSAGLTDMENDAKLAVEENKNYDKKLTEIETQLNLVNFLKDFIENPDNENKTIPSNAGLTDASLNAMINSYNQYVLERNLLLQNATMLNPKVVSLTTAIEQLKESIRVSVETFGKTLAISKEDIRYQINRFASRISNTPTLEREYGGLARTQEVKAGLYLMLLQKKEENSLYMAATADNVKIIDDAVAGDYPVKPNRSMAWLMALFIGVAIPVCVIYLLELLRYRIEGRNDLEFLTEVPVLGDVAFSYDIKKSERAIVVKKNKNDIMAETFRSIRTNLQFTLENKDDKVILFTSTTSGEGKTFVSSNMATSLALLGKKVILIGLDIRKPRLASMFDVMDKKRGITTFLAGDPNDKELLFEQISHTDLENLDVLPSGIVPPNPAELLAKVNLDKAIEYLSAEYDYIILDTPPVGLVIDAFIIARVTKATVYVCRADYTAKADIMALDDLRETGKLPNMSLVLNGVDMKKKKYGYYYGHSRYGYGYGYGSYAYGGGRYVYNNYGYGYRNNEDDKA